MPKPGYTSIIVKESVRSHLQKLAEAQDYRTINQLLEAWLVVYPGVNPTNTNGKIRHPKISLKQAPFQESSSKSLVGSGRFELPSRAPEARSLDQASRRPHAL